MKPKDVENAVKALATVVDHGDDCLCSDCEAALNLLGRVSPQTQEILNTVGKALQPKN